MQLRSWPHGNSETFPGKNAMTGMICPPQSLQAKLLYLPFRRLACLPCWGGWYSNFLRTVAKVYSQGIPFNLELGQNKCVWYSSIWTQGLRRTRILSFNNRGIYLFLSHLYLLLITQPSFWPVMGRDRSVRRHHSAHRQQGYSPDFVSGGYVIFMRLLYNILGGNTTTMSVRLPCMVSPRFPIRHPARRTRCTTRHHMMHVLHRE